MSTISALSRLTIAFLVAVLLAACGSSRDVTAKEAPAQDPPSPATQAADLVTRWTIIVTERFERSRAFKSDSTDELFDQFMSVGAVRAVRDKATAEKIREADRTVDLFARAAIAAGEKSSDGSVEVTESSVTAAVKSTCPVYPFC